MNASASWGVSWFNYPNILFGLRLFYLEEVLVELSELSGQNISVWYKVSSVLAKAFLHFWEVEAQAVLTSNFVGWREMIDTLVVIEALIEKTLAGWRGPKDVPLMWVSIRKTIGFQQGADEVGITLEYLIEKIWILEVVRFLPCRTGR